MNLRRPTAVVVLLGIGFIAGYAFGRDGVMNSIKQSFTPIKEKGTSYTFVHPLLAYRTPEATVLGDYVGLKNSFQTIVDAETGSRRVSRMAVYFRDLDAGRWVGINQNDTYYPASLLKVPITIAYFKEAEENPSVLNQVITYDPSVIPNDPFNATSTLVAGRPYSVNELINHMITDSDNGATFTLLNHINPEFLHASYVALGIPDPGDDSANYQISARTYALFFRVLYNTTYLSPAFSERALKLLSEATFTNGLDAGVPKGTLVAHKFGEHVLSQNGVTQGVELSDCGIIYYPAHPYLLCVMTSASDISAAENSIAKISTTAYAAVAEQYRVN